VLKNLPFALKLRYQHALWQGHGCIVSKPETIPTLAAGHFGAHEKRGLDQVRLVIEADPVNLPKM
jgi:hypothetical protein